jgi:hypothetical protein
MIKFALSCDRGHAFEAWFAKSADYDDQSARNLVSCPQCGSTKVTKALMAPAVTGTRKADSAMQPLAMSAEQAEKLKKIREMVSAIRSSSEDVGDRFPEEARKIHYGETEERGIIGRAAPDEARALLEEGIAVAPLPHFPDNAN